MLGIPCKVNVSTTSVSALDRIAECFKACLSPNLVVRSIAYSHRCKEGEETRKGISISWFLCHCERAADMIPFCNSIGGEPSLKDSHWLRTMEFLCGHCPLQALADTCNAGHRRKLRRIMRKSRWNQRLEFAGILHFYLTLDNYRCGHASL